MEYAKLPTTLSTQWISVTPVLEQPLWSLAMQNKLRKLAELPANWNSYGSPPVASAAVEISLNVLGNLKRLNMPEPHVVPVPGGGIQFEWENEKCGLEIEILPNRRVEFLIVDSEGKMAEGRVYNPEDAAQLSCLTHWYTEQKDSVTDLLQAHAATS